MKRRGAQLRASFNFPVRLLFYCPPDMPEEGPPVYREDVVLFKEEIMKVFTVEYHYVTDRDEEMAEVRPTHRAFNGELATQGHLIAAGPYTGTHDALIIVRAEDAAGALELLEADPFNQAGFIAKRIPREWNPVIGSIPAEG